MGVKITFNGVPDVNDIISFSYDINFPLPPVEVFICAGVFKTSRTEHGEVTIGPDPVQQAINCQAAFLIDYGVQFTILRNENELYIESKNDWKLLGYSSSGSAVNLEVSDGLFSDNPIHEIIFTPRKYSYPALMLRDFLITEDDFFIITEDNKKIRL